MLNNEKKLKYERTIFFRWNSEADHPRPDHLFDLALFYHCGVTKLHLVCDSNLNDSNQQFKYLIIYRIVHQSNIRRIRKAGVK